MLLYTLFILEALDSVMLAHLGVSVLLHDVANEGLHLSSELVLRLLVLGSSEKLGGALGDEGLGGCEEIDLSLGESLESLVVHVSNVGQSSDGERRLDQRSDPVGSFSSHISLGRALHMLDRLERSGPWHLGLVIVGHDSSGEHSLVGRVVVGSHALHGSNSNLGGGTVLLRSLGHQTQLRLLQRVGELDHVGGLSFLGHSRRNWEGLSTVDSINQVRVSLLVSSHDLRHLALVGASQDLDLVAGHKVPLALLGESLPLGNGMAGQNLLELGGLFESGPLDPIHTDPRVDGLGVVDEPRFQYRPRRSHCVRVVVCMSSDENENFRPLPCWEGSREMNIRSISLAHRES